MKKTLILCFIHGFKGGDDTFGPNYEFTEHLRHLIAKELPKINVKVLVYPKFETRGDLGETVSRFRDWLQDKVIDLEVENGTPSPTVEPSVRTILVGHSMGGIVAAETVIGITSEKPIYSEDGIQKPDNPSSFNSLMFPYIQGVLAFDTPYLGISPGVVARGAEGHYNTATAAMTQLSGLSTTFGAAGLWGAGKANAPVKPSAGALPAPESKGKATGSGWGTWGKVAMGAVAAGAVAAGGVAAWQNRDHITEGWSWASDHLAYVGCLARPEELKKRVTYMVKLNSELDVGFANLYTRLGKNANPKQVSMVGTVLGPDRTFCNLPKTMRAGNWMAAVNSNASDETSAHMTMFVPDENPGYEAMSQEATNLVVKWLQNDWYQSSFEEKGRVEL